MQTRILDKRFLLLAFSIVSLFLLFNFAVKAEANIFEDYFQVCEPIIASNWLNKSVPAFNVDKLFVSHAKAVISFSLDQKGNIKHLQIKHSARESLLTAAQHKFRAEADNNLRKSDLSMLDSLQRSSPMPAPPLELHCPRTMVAIFDADRFHPLILMLDEQIESSSKVRELIK